MFIRRNPKEKSMSFMKIEKKKKLQKINLTRCLRISLSILFNFLTWAYSVLMRGEKRECCTNWLQEMYSKIEESDSYVHNHQKKRQEPLWFLQHVGLLGNLDLGRYYHQPCYSGGTKFQL